MFCYIRKLLIVVALLTTIILIGCGNNLVSVKYRSDKVDISHPRFEHLNTSGSSLVQGSWYDSDNGYMIINLNGTYYHYCGLPENTWINFKVADSFGTYYNSSIKGSFDCRVGYIPEYSD